MGILLPSLGIYQIWPPPQFLHPVLQSAGAQALRLPAFDQRLDVLGLQALDVHVPEAHLVELVRDQGSWGVVSSADSSTAGLMPASVTVIAIMPGES
jgi:hypothetical protein